MGGAMLALALLLGVGIGVYTHATLLPYVLKNERFEERLRDKAIQKHYECTNNAYTYFPEGKDDFYILTLNKEEHRIKFSKNRPYEIIYDAVVDFE